MMRASLMLVGLLLGCQAQPAAPEPPPPIDPLRVAFVAQCRYENGSRILLIHRFASDSYRFIINRGSYNDLTTIRAGTDSALEVETNGGVGKMAAVDALLDWLLRQPFRAIAEDGFATEVQRNDVPACPGDYPFSP